MSPTRSQKRLPGLSIRGQQILAGLLLVASALSLSAWPRDDGPVTHTLGQIQPTTVIAEIDFPILKDPEVLERERRQRVESVPMVVARNDSSSISAYNRLNSVRRRVRSLRREEAKPDDRRAETGSELVLSFSQPTLVALLLGDRWQELIDQADLLLHDVMQRGFVTPELALELADHPTVRIEDPLGAVTVPSSILLTADRIRELAQARAVARDLPPAVLTELVLHCVEPNLSVNTADTEILREEAVAQVDPHTRVVKRGEKIIGAHERITRERLQVLRSYEYWKGEGHYQPGWFERVRSSLGDVLVVLVLLSVFAIYLLIHRPSLLARPADFWLLTTIEVVVLLLGGFLVRILDLPHLLVPVAAVAVLVTLLFDVRLAVAASLLPVFLIGIVADGGVYFVGVVGLGVVVSVLLTPSLRQRRQFYRILGTVALAHLAMLIGLSLSGGGSKEIFAREAVAAVANPFLATAVVFSLLPIYENLFNRCTDLSLFELVDLNRGLLQRLMMTAPGTYHHSLMVGSLAESAAQAIGAQPLLARVIGYYHDIGKLTKPEFFPENARHGRKGPREKLNPSVVRLILESHVREGVSLALGERMPREVIEGIREHHGARVMTEVLLRAREADPAVEERDFRYPGPIPTSRESALVLLANEVESATRNLEDPSPSRIKGMVIRVVQENLESGNLDGSGLSLTELAQVRQVFVTILSAAIRGRSSAVRRGEDGNQRKSDPDHPANSGTDL